MSTDKVKADKEAVLEALEGYFRTKGLSLALEKGAVQVVFKRRKLDRIRVTRYTES